MGEFSLGTGMGMGRLFLFLILLLLAMVIETVYDGVVEPEKSVSLLVGRPYRR